MWIMFLIHTWLWLILSENDRTSHLVEGVCQRKLEQLRCCNTLHFPTFHQHHWTVPSFQLDFEVSACLWDWLFLKEGALLQLRWYDILGKNDDLQEENKSVKTPQYVQQITDSIFKPACTTYQRTQTTHRALSAAQYHRNRTRESCESCSHCHINKTMC